MLHDEGRLEFNGPHPELEVYPSWSTVFRKASRQSTCAGSWNSGSL